MVWTHLYTCGHRVNIYMSIILEHADRYKCTYPCTITTWTCQSVFPFCSQVLEVTFMPIVLFSPIQSYSLVPIATGGTVDKVKRTSLGLGLLAIHINLRLPAFPGRRQELRNTSQKAIVIHHQLWQTILQYHDIVYCKPLRKIHHKEQPNPFIPCSKTAATLQQAMVNNFQTFTTFPVKFLHSWSSLDEVIASATYRRWVRTDEWFMTYRPIAGFLCGFDWKKSTSLVEVHGRRELGGRNAPILMGWAFLWMGWLKR